MALDAVAFGENDPGQRASHEREGVPVQEVVPTGGDGSETQGIEATRSGVYEILCTDSESNRLLAEDPDLRQALETYVSQFGNVSAGSSWNIHIVGSGSEGLVYVAERSHRVGDRSIRSRIAVKVIDDHAEGSDWVSAGAFPAAELGDGAEEVDGSSGCLQPVLWPTEEGSPSEKVRFARLLLEAQSVRSRKRYQILRFIEGQNGEEVSWQLRELQDREMLPVSEAVALKMLLTARYLDAVEQMDRQGVICIDPKPGNCVVDVLHGGQVNGVDTGSLTVGGEQTIVRGSPQYAAPELGCHSAKTPVYAFGNMLATCISGKTVNMGMLDRHFRVPPSEFKPQEIMAALLRIDTHGSDVSPPDDVAEYLQLRDASIRQLQGDARGLDGRYGTDVFSQIASLAIRMLSLRADERPSLVEAQAELNALLQRLRTVQGVHPEMDARFSAVVLGWRRRFERNSNSVLLHVPSSLCEVMFLEDGGIRVQPHGSDGGKVRIIAPIEIARDPAAVLRELGVRESRAGHLGEALRQYQHIYSTRDVQMFLNRKFPRLVHGVASSPEGVPVILVEAGLVRSVRGALKGRMSVRVMPRVMTAEAVERQEADSQIQEIQRITKEAGSPAASVRSDESGGVYQYHVKVQADMTDPRMVQTVICEQLNATTRVGSFTTREFANRRALDVAREIRYCNRDMDQLPDFEMIPQEVGEFEKLTGPLTLRVCVRREDVGRVRQAIETGLQKYHWPEVILIDVVDDVSRESEPAQTERVAVPV